MANADFPGDTFLSVYILEDAEPPHELAFYQLRHCDEDPSVGTVLVEDGSRTSGMDETDMRSLRFIGVPLATACDADGNLVYGNKARRGFDLSLAPWLHDDRKLRVVALTQTVLRFAEFTPEQHRIWGEVKMRLAQHAKDRRDRARGRQTRNFERNNETGEFRNRSQIANVEGSK